MLLGLGSVVGISGSVGGQGEAHHVEHVDAAGLDVGEGHPRHLVGGAVDLGDAAALAAELDGPEPPTVEVPVPVNVDPVIDEVPKRLKSFTWCSLI